MDPNSSAEHRTSMYFLFVLLPRWEETGTICPVCWPDGSLVSDRCIHTIGIPWTPPDPGTTISGETAGGN